MAYLLWGVRVNPWKLLYDVLFCSEVVWENHPDDVMFMSSGLPRFWLWKFLTESLCYKVGHDIWRIWAFTRQKSVQWKMLLSCSMGNIGSSRFGALPILETKSREISNSLIFWLFFCVSVTRFLTLWKFDTKLLECSFNGGQ